MTDHFHFQSRHFDFVVINNHRWSLTGSDWHVKARYQQSSNPIKLLATTSLITLSDAAGPPWTLSYNSQLWQTFCTMNEWSKSAKCITKIWKNCFRTVAMEVVEQAEVLIIPAEVQIKFTRRRFPFIHPSRSLLTEVLDPLTSVIETSSAHHFLFLLVCPKFPNFPAKWRPWYANRSHDPVIYCLPSALKGISTQVSSLSCCEKAAGERALY